MKNYRNYYLSNYDLTDIKISNVIVIHIYLMLCKNMLISTNGFFFALNDMLNLVITGVFVLIYAKLFITTKVLKQTRISIFVILILVVLFWLVTYLSYPERFTLNIFPYNYVKRNLRAFLAYCLPLFVVVGSMRSVDCLLEKLFDYTMIPFLFSSVSFVFSLQYNEDGNYMTFGNAVMVLCVILIFKWNQNKSLVLLLQIFSCSAYIILSGSRGSIFGVVVAFLFFLIINKDIKRRSFWIVLTIILGTSFLLNFNEFLNTVISFLDMIGVESRTIRLASIGEFLNDSGRSVYHQKLLRKLNEQPIIGLGAFGGEASVGLAHSLYLDVFANLGYLLGFIYLAFIALKIIYLVIVRKNTAYAILLLIFSAIVFPLGTVGFSFWESKELWMIMALLTFDRKFISNKQFEYRNLWSKLI